MPLTDRVAVVTGAGRGIGRQIAVSLAARGAKLSICSMHESTIEPVAAEIRESGGEALALVADVSSEQDVERLVSETYERYGQVDILVNNAGVNRDNFFLRLSAESWDEVIAVNLRGAFLCTRHFSRKMMRNKRGRIINMASVAGEAGNMGQANYSAAKAGVIGLTKSCAKELARYGITVNAVSPGLIETDMLGEMETSVLEDLKKSIPAGRLGTVQDIADATCFLASDSAAYITGQVLRVDGGLYM
ncbi:MAG TPA: 3-oxoacyl-[acyl-carrier-protein] reductase [bacterium]|nr:3-oxoacyl-[acyl-carrier-protein] reductase [bacterium]